jgi:hypothetical protein
MRKLFLLIVLIVAAPAGAGLIVPDEAEAQAALLSALPSFPVSGFTVIEATPFQWGAPNEFQFVFKATATVAHYQDTLWRHACEDLPGGLDGSACAAKARELDSEAMLFRGLTLGQRWELLPLGQSLPIQGSIQFQRDGRHWVTEVLPAKYYRD